jgi:hypothetical protein
MSDVEGSGREEVYNEDSVDEMSDVKDDDTEEKVREKVKWARERRRMRRQTSDRWRERHHLRGQRERKRDGFADDELSFWEWKW